jgi:tRNA (guanine37-N1)-methyltransferase
MKFSILTLFPEAILPYMQSSMMGRALDKQLISLEVLNPRDFSLDKHKKVDDTPYGGGPGMVLMCQPFDDAYQQLQPLQQPARVLMTAPAGRVFDHAFAMELAACEQVVIFCGHYEGFDQRLLDLIPELEPVSIGDFVLTGGELPALVMMDAISRHIPDVVQQSASVQEDSFYSGLLDHPHYTRPAEYKGLLVPSVLLSGNHQAIAHWRQQAALEATQHHRQDLLDRKH